MNAKILIIDDSSFARRTLRKLLEEMGHTVDEAQDGAQALERFFLQPPDLVILDMVMTGMDGTEVLSKLREMNPAARVIVATADIQKSTAELVRLAGAKGILNKPVHREQLAAALDAVLAGGETWDLNETQQDALTELINIGYGRAAAALAELTGYRITLEVPRISMHTIEAIGPLLEGLHGPEIVSVNQRFSGPVSGTAMLLVDESSALGLSRMLSEERPGVRDFDANAKEVITEVGNILLNACLGVFGNLLEIRVIFAVPVLQIDRVPRVLRAVADRSEEPLRYGLVIHTHFRAKAGEMSGYLVIVLGIASLDRLLQEVEKWENRQVR